LEKACIHPPPSSHGSPVLACWLQVKIKKGDTDLAIDQLREVFRVLAVDKVPTSKLEKRLDDLAHKWDEIKKVQPQVKSDVEPIQVGWRARCQTHATNKHAETAPNDHRQRW
jgi:hypothetical protein